MEIFLLQWPCHRTANSFSHPADLADGVSGLALPSQKAPAAPRSGPSEMPMTSRACATSPAVSRERQRWPDACRWRAPRHMVHGHDSQALRQFDETYRAHDHALEVLGQWQELQSAVERLKATTSAATPPEPDPKLAA
jgi:hypothetical protein